MGFESEGWTSRSDRKLACRSNIGAQTKVTVPIRKRSISNPALISLALITYIISNQSIMSIMSTSKSLTTDIRHMASERDRFLLIGLASASPAPEPAAGRSATSSSHRVPPINGSIFGKRSLGGNQMIRKNNGASQTDASPQINETPKDLEPDTRQLLQQPKKSVISKQDSDIIIRREQGPPSMIKPRTSEAISYKDIITELIEEFLALNNESDPEEASVAFCRMIVYECGQMLSARQKALARQRLKKKARSSSVIS